MIRRSTLLVLELALGLAAAALLAGGALVWRLALGPVELPGFVSQLEQGLSEARAGRPVSIERLDLVWNAAAHALELRARDVALRDENGAPLTVARHVSVAVHPWSLLIGRMSVTRAAFVGGELSVVFAEDGTARVAVGPPGSTPDFVIPAPPQNETAQQRVSRILDGFAAALAPVGPGGKLEALSLRDAQLTIVDTVRDGQISADKASLELIRTRDTMRLRFGAALDGPDGPAPVRVEIATDTAFQAALFNLTANGVTPRLLAPPGALGPFSGLNAPTDATVSAGLDRQTGLTHFEGRIALGAGEVEIAGGRFSLASADIAGRYHDEDDVLEISRLAIDGDRTAVTGTIRVRDASRLWQAGPGETAAVALELPSARLAMPGILAEPVTLTDARIEGDLRLADRRFTLTQVRASVDEATMSASGAVSWAETPNGWRPGLNLTGRVDGVLDARAVLRFWPVRLGDGARTWLDDALIAGRMTNTVFSLALAPEHFGAAPPNEAVDVRFDYADAEVRYISTMTPLTAATGRGRLQGNRFDLEVERGWIGEVAVSNGVVLLPRLSPKGAMSTIRFEGRGAAQEVLRILAQEPIGLGERLPVDLDTVQGEGTFAVQLRRPMRAETAPEDLRFAIEGAFSGIGARARDRDLTLADWDLAVTGDEQSLRLSGPLRVNGSPVMLDWTESLREDEATPSRILATGLFEAADLDRLGLPVTSLAIGRIGVQVRALGEGFDIDTGNLTLDLSEAAVFLPARLWNKPSGAPAEAAFRVDRSTEGYILTDIALTADAVAIAGGQADFGADHRLRMARFDRIRIGDTIDVALAAQRRADQVLEIRLNGAAFEAARYLEADLSESPAALASAARPASPRQRYAVIIDAARLRMRGGVDLHNATVAASLRDDILVSLTAEALTAGGDPIRLAMGPRPNDPAGGVAFSTGDAGLALTALTGAEIVIGGRAQATGVWSPGARMNADFNLAMSDFRVVDVPAMAQLLSMVASIQGVADTLSGEGIAITSLEAPLALRGDLLTIGESRASGPALGFTGSGGFDMDTGEIDLNGVVVPSYGLNSMWGHLPIVGGLLVSRQGEGVVGITFSMNGPIEKADIGVNPLSALAPGIFRRIFEPLPTRPAASARVGGG